MLIILPSLVYVSVFSLSFVKSSSSPVERTCLFLGESLFTLCFSINKLRLTEFSLHSASLPVSSYPAPQRLCHPVPRTPGYLPGITEVSVVLSSSWSVVRSTAALGSPLAVRATLAELLQCLVPGELQRTKMSEMQQLPVPAELQQSPVLEFQQPNCS